MEPRSNSPVSARRLLLASTDGLEHSGGEGHDRRQTALSGAHAIAGASEQPGYAGHDVGAAFHELSPLASFEDWQALANKAATPKLD